MTDYKPTGMFINKDDKGQYIYSDFLCDGGFAIPKSKYGNYRVYALRYYISIVAGALLSTFTENIKVCVLVGIFSAVVGEILFRTKFLKKACNHLPRYKAEKKSIIDSIDKNTPAEKKLIKAITLILLAIVVIINAYIEKYSQMVIYACWGISVLCLAMSAVYFVTFFRKGEKK